MQALQFKYNHMYVIFGGDLNTDLSKNMLKHTKSLMQYCIDDDIIICSGTIYFSMHELYSYCIFSHYVWSQLYSTIFTTEGNANYNM